jgi:hypothetical protein
MDSQQSVINIMDFAPKQKVKVVSPVKSPVKFDIARQKSIAAKKQEQEVEDEIMALIALKM